MAKRPVFIANPKIKGFVEVEYISFIWYSGFALSQKQKSIESLHNNFLEKNPTESVLEISTKSNTPLGVNLSAFNLALSLENNKIFSVESVFQSSKVFEKGGPFLDLLEKNPKESKKDIRLQNSGKLLYFLLGNDRWSLEPKTLFYDWLYINSLLQNKHFINQIIKYSAFTDIEFNPNKSFNCQAKSAALFVSLYCNNLINESELISIDKFIRIYQ